MWLSFFYKSISDLNGLSLFKEETLSKLKKIIDILIIDDDEFPFLKALQKHEFSIEQRSDLSSLKDAEAYDIILCDIRGVGKFLQSTYEGANLIKQIKIKYPTKTVIAYSANDYDAAFQQYLDYADTIVPKGSYAIEDWCSLLDKLIQERANPIKQWELTRNELLQANVSTLLVAKYESDYVKAIQKGSFESIKKLYEHQSSSGAHIMTELLSSTIAKLFESIVIPGGK